METQFCNTSKEEIHIPGRSYRPQGWIIPACPEGKPFSSIVIGEFTDKQIVYTSYKSFGQDVKEIPVPIKMQEIITDLFAQERLKERGCFTIPADSIPTQAQIDEAVNNRLAWLKKLVDHGDMEFRRTGKIGNIPEYCKRAVAELKLKRDWTLAAIPNLVECPACGDSIKSGVAVCKSCGAILDKEKAAEFGLGEDRVPVPVAKGKPGRPRKQREVEAEPESMSGI